MSVSMNDVRVATRSHLKLLDSTIETDWEGQDFTPTNGVEYQSVYLMAGDVNDITISDSSKSHYILQVTLRYPTNEGTFGIETKASDIVSHFDRGLVLERNGLKIRVENTPTIRNLGVDLDREIRTVSINLVVYY